jgi:2-succinyl-5-enolpyruvyl-6-hydroxy-3-cyclohexene-1-carboxylate synthase
MKEKFYTAERSQQIVISLLKQHGIHKVIASPGTTNITLVASMQQDPWFEMYSSADERSAAYMACGLAAESGEPVVLSCTGATASRNYVPGLTEAYYRKLPVLAITATQDETRVGHLAPQVIDRSQQQKDIVVLSEHIAACRDANDEWDAMIKTNRAILALKHHGGGPVHINLATAYNQDFSVKELPVAHKINRYTLEDELPVIKGGRVAIWASTHNPWTKELSDAVDTFCERYDAVVFCDQTSNYHGQYRAQMGITATQKSYSSPLFNTDLLIHIGEVTADYATMGCVGATKQVWRINEDGELRDPFHKLSNVFEMSELAFFRHYAKDGSQPKGTNNYIKECIAEEKKFKALVPELPFSNIWIAQHTAPLIPESSVAHFGILNTIRAWNMWDMPSSVDGFCNAGGFGIDGDMSTCIGATLAHPEQLHFLMVGDLAFFYDLNSMGNRHVGNNLRIMLINNGRGAEFRNYNHPGAAFGEKADDYIAAAGHYGKQSHQLVKHYAEDLGYEYLSAENKEEYLEAVKKFVNAKITDRPIVFEIFTDYKAESDALQTVDFLAKGTEQIIKKIARKVLPGVFIDGIKKILK